MNEIESEAKIETDRQRQKQTEIRARNNGRVGHVDKKRCS